jgi:hypothetical protein
VGVVTLSLLDEVLFDFRVTIQGVVRIKSSNRIKNLIARKGKKNKTAIAYKCRNPRRTHTGPSLINCQPPASALHAAYVLVCTYRDLMPAQIHPMCLPHLSHPPAHRALGSQGIPLGALQCAHRSGASGSLAQLRKPEISRPWFGMSCVWPRYLPHHPSSHTARGTLLGTV